MNKKYTKQPPRIIWLLTALASGTIGAVFFYFLTVLPFYGLWKTRDLVQVPATIKKWDLKVSKGSSRSAASVSIDAAYEYSVGNQIFIGNRVSLFNYDNDIYYDHRENADLMIYIDPRDPAFSVIHREVDFSWLIFCLAVPAILLLLFFATLSAFFRTRSKKS